MLWELKWKIELVLKIIGRAFVEPNNRTAREAGWVGEKNFQKYIGRDWVGLSPIPSQCTSLRLMAVLKTGSLLKIGHLLLLVISSAASLSSTAFHPLTYKKLLAQGSLTV